MIFAALSDTTLPRRYSCQAFLNEVAVPIVVRSLVGGSACCSGTPSRARCGTLGAASPNAQGREKSERYLALSSAGLLGLGGATLSRIGT